MKLALASKHFCAWVQIVQTSFAQSLSPNFIQTAEGHFEYLPADTHHLVKQINNYNSVNEMSDAPRDKWQKKTITGDGKVRGKKTRKTLRHCFFDHISLVNVRNVHLNWLIFTCGIIGSAAPVSSLWSRLIFFPIHTRFFNLVLPRWDTVLVF